MIHLSYPLINEIILGFVACFAFKLSVFDTLSTTAAYSLVQGSNHNLGYFCVEIISFPCECKGFSSDTLTSSCDPEA